MKKVKDILSYPAIFDPITEKRWRGGFNVSFPDFPGCYTFGASFEEATKMAEEALSLWIEHLQDHGEKLPERTGSLIINEIRAKVAVPK
jgi:predicted RNase H-like HicB family nuclease